MTRCASAPTSWATLQRVHPTIGAGLLPTLLAEGLTYAEVAGRLVVSVNTVRFHVKEKSTASWGSTARRRP